MRTSLDWIDAVWSKHGEEAGRPVRIEVFDHIIYLSVGCVRELIGLLEGVIDGSED